MGVLQLGKPEVAPFENTTGGVRIDVAAKGRGHGTVRLLAVAVEIGNQS